MAAQPAGQLLRWPLGICGDRLVSDPVLQVQRQLTGGLVPAIRLIGHGLEADGLELRGHRRHELTRCHQVSRFHPGDDGGGVLCREREFSREQLVERGSQAVHVAHRAQFFDRPAGLFRAHVGRRSNGGSGLGLAGRG